MHQFHVIVNYYKPDLGDGEVGRRGGFWLCPNFGDGEESWADVEDSGFVQDASAPASSGSYARSQ